MGLEVISDEEKKPLNLHFSPEFEEIRAYAIEHDVPVIQDEGLAFLESIVRLKRPAHILEIGCAIGYSSSRMALAGNCKVTTVERDIQMYECATNNIKKLGLENQVRIIFKDALEITDEIENEHYDMIFIDAAKGQSRRFFQKFEAYLNPNGVIVTDNMIFHGLITAEIHNRNLKQLVRKIKEYHEFLLTNENYNTSIFKIGDGMAVSVKK